MSRREARKQTWEKGTGMENEDKKNDAGEGASEETGSTDQKGLESESGEKNAPEGSEGASEGGGVSEEDLTDKHGQEAIAKGRYDRDMAAKDKEIADLKSQIDESAKTEAGRKALEEKIEALEGKQADMHTEYELKLAGCRDDKALKAAKTLIGDYDGDVSKLKSECPYLFDAEKQKGKTGFKPEGPTGDIDAKLDKAFGLKK